MTVSVIIITRNRFKQLKNCLDCLMAQTSFPQEVLIVDSSDNGETKKLVEKYQKSAKPKIIYHKVSHVSVSFSRNQGLKRANGDIIAFTDDDCYPLRDWIKEIIKAHQGFPEAMAIGGRVINKNTQNFWAGTASRMQAVYMLSSGTIHEEPFLLTSNLSLKKNIILKEKMFFDEELLGGEDVDLCRRLKEKGYKVLYNPKIVVEHDFRTSLKGFLSQWFFYGKSSVRVCRKNNYSLAKVFLDEFLSFRGEKIFKFKLGIFLGRISWALGFFYELLDIKFFKKIAINRENL